MPLPVHRLFAALALIALVTAMPPARAQQTGTPARTEQPSAAGNTVRQPAPSARRTSGPQRRGQPASSPRVAQQPPRGGGQLPAVRNPTPRAPFTLTPTQQQLLDQVLRQWERQSDRIKTFKTSFSRWEVDATFGPKEFDYVRTKGTGYIKFKEPDHGVYRITELTEWDKQKGVYVPRASGLDHWVCTGESIFEFNYEKRQLIERELAPEFRGKAITDGPLPFVFGAKADQLKRRYWMRDITQPANVNQQIWLEAWPKFQQDAANYQHAIVILNRKTFIPEALRIILPDGQNKQDFAFSNTQVNDPLSILKGDFWPPIKPLGWTSVFEPAESSRQVAPPAQRPAQAQRAAPEARK